MSLLVSVVLLGFKLSAVKRLVQVNQRRTELTEALTFLHPKPEQEDLAMWLDDVDQDAKQREDRITELLSASGVLDSLMESEAIERCLGMFALFDSISGTATELKRPASVARSETKYNEATGLLLGRAEATLRAAPQAIVAYMLNLDSRYMLSWGATDVNVVRYEVLDVVNAHHTIGFARYKAKGVSDRTFLMSTIAKQLAEDPPTFVVACVSIPSHKNIGPKDEKGAVRAENYRSFVCTEVAPGVTKLEYCCSIDLKGWVPKIVTNTIVVPTQLNHLQATQLYFQQLRPLTNCDPEDGQVVAHLLMDLVRSKPKYLAHAIRTYANRTAMLRGCGFRHIGDALVALLTAFEKSDYGSVPAVALEPAQGPSSLTAEQASAIGYMIVSNTIRSHVPAAALHKLVKSHLVLRTMHTHHAWFVPMLEALVNANVVGLRQSTKQFSAIGTPKLPSEALIKVTSSDLCSVVRPYKSAPG